MRSVQQTRVYQKFMFQSSDLHKTHILMDSKTWASVWMNGWIYNFSSLSLNCSHMPVCTLKELVAKISPPVHVGHEDTHLTWLTQNAGDLSGPQDKVFRHCSEKTILKSMCKLSQNCPRIKMFFLFIVIIICGRDAQSMGGVHKVTHGHPDVSYQN